VKFDLETLKREVLSDLVHEDHQGLWEPLWSLRGDDRTEPERQALAERVLRELFEDGLVYFFRVPPPYTQVKEAGEDETLRSTAQEVHETLRGDRWRGRDGIQVRDGEPTVWFGATPKAEALD
jgi:hypothetical protein